MKIQTTNKVKFLEENLLNKDNIGGQIFSVEFVKNDGSIRQMTCRLGVTKHLKGGERSYDPSDLQKMIVFDMAKKEYRTINLDTVLKIKLDGVTYELA